MCGMESPNESVTANFGKDPFVFNVESYAKVCDLFIYYLFNLMISNQHVIKNCN